MKSLSQVVITLLAAVNFLAAGMALPASCKTCPCCAKAEAQDTGTTCLREPMHCQMKGAASSESATLNTGMEEPDGYPTVSLDETAPLLASLMNDVPRPDYARWAFESPPVYLINSSLVC